MKNKIKYFLLTLLMFVMPFVSNADTNNVILNIPKNKEGIVENGIYNIYDVTDIYNKIDNKDEKEHEDLSVELKNKSLKEVKNLKAIKSIESQDGKLELSLDDTKSYLIKEENDYIIPVPIIGPIELSNRNEPLEITPKIQDKFRLTIKKLVDGTDYKDIPFNIVVKINGKEENIKLKAYEEKEFLLLPNDEYEVKEINLPNGYTLKNIENDRGTIKNKDLETIINNKYEAKGKFDIEFKKILNNKELEDNEFVFELLDENNKIIQTAKNDKNGKVVFKDIELDKAGTYNYKVREINNGLEGIEYDDNIYEFKVIAEDNNDGTLSIKKEDKDILFKNTFKEKVKYGNLRIEKTVIDNDTEEEFEITINLYDEKGKELTEEFGAVSNKKGNLTVKSGNTINISHNEIITINKLPLGSKYEITEKDYEHYSLSKKSIVSGYIKDITDAHLYNQYIKPELTKLSIKKEVVGEDFNNNQYFEFRVTIGDEEQTIKLKNGEVKTFDNIPLNTEYKIEEINIPEHYTLKEMKDKEGILDKEKDIIAINKYEKPVIKEHHDEESKTHVKTGVKGVGAIIILLLVTLSLYLIFRKKETNLS